MNMPRCFLGLQDNGPHSYVYGYYWGRRGAARSAFWRVEQNLATESWNLALPEFRCRIWRCPVLDGREPAGRLWDVSEGACGYEDVLRSLGLMVYIPEDQRDECQGDYGFLAKPRREVLVDEVVA